MTTEKNLSLENLENLRQALSPLGGARKPNWTKPTNQTNQKILAVLVKVELI